MPFGCKHGFFSIQYSNKNLTNCIFRANYQIYDSPIIPRIWHIYTYIQTYIFQTTHLVVNNAEKSADSYKGRMAQKYGIPIVSTSFVDVSVERGELMEPDDFLAVGKTAAEQFQTGKIIGTVICIVYICHYIDVCIIMYVFVPNYNNYHI